MVVPRVTDELLLDQKRAQSPAPDTKPATPPSGDADSGCTSSEIIQPPSSSPPNAPRSKRPVWRSVLRGALKGGLYGSPLLVIGGVLLVQECKTSRWQARYLSKVASEATYTVEPGPNPTPWFPSFGPYDERLGYTRIPGIVESLTKSGFQVTEQTRLSERFRQITEDGFYPPYDEKSKTGISILDRNQELIYAAHRPQRIYESFGAVPDIVVKTLLYIENREILDQQYPTKNPAVEWDRLGKAVLEKIKQIFNPDLNAPGGSTIATQLEKYRHSREGRTSGISDKLRQMMSASLRAYKHGPNTLETRKSIVLQYINSIPLAALPGYGEVNGLGDGLWAWYGSEFDDMNSRLRALSEVPAGGDITPFAADYKRMLSLFIAHRRPSFYLIAGLHELNALTNTYLDLLANEGVIPAALRDAAKGIPLTLQRAAPQASRISYVQRKAANAIRTRLLQLTHYPQLYDLDQVDLAVKSSIDNGANEAVTAVLRDIKDEKSVKKYGLSGARNLSKGDPSKVIYSLTLYERVGNANVLRVQTDNFDNPFSINEGTRLDLGSTAKLRTLTTYLDIVSELFERYKGFDEANFKDLLKQRKLDPISLFVVETVSKDKKITLAKLLDLALQRHYSANPGESFFTGGGLHTFENFKKEDNGRDPTIREALIHSINLPFIRLMRDISRYYTARKGVNLSSASGDRKNPERMRFLRQFADNEGSFFLRRFYEKHINKPANTLLQDVIKGNRASAKHAAVMYRYVRPNDSLEGMQAFLTETLPNAKISPQLAEAWYADFAPGKFSLNDQGYLARIHPLELWLVRYLQNNPKPPVSQVLDASKQERQEVYEWLFKTPHVRAQDIRIRTLIENESFADVHKQWRKMGYPFASMVPSLASAIGSSGDRPIALAELVGIILNDGVRYPLVRLDELHFAAGTPYETKLARIDAQPGERVLQVEVARALKGAMKDVVESGTARRVFKAFKRSDGKAYTIGGKTGTGDHRYEVYGPGGHLISSRVVNRTATFAFYLGDRFFGVISAHVPGAEAAKFDFTSALAAELLKVLSSSLEPMIERSGAALSPFEEDTLKAKGKGATTTPAAAGPQQTSPAAPQVVTTPAPQGIEQQTYSASLPAVKTPAPTAAPAATIGTASPGSTSNDSLKPDGTAAPTESPVPPVPKKRVKPKQVEQSLPVVLVPPS